MSQGRFRLQKKKVSIDLNIKALSMQNMREQTDVLILWKQRSKSIDTRVQKLSADNSIAIFDERFQMKTAIDWDTMRNKFGKKQSVLAVFTKDRSRLLGEADFDLGTYANDPNKNTIVDRLKLRNCEQDRNAYIEVHIKAKILDDATSTPTKRPSVGNGVAAKQMNYNNSMLLPAIEERNSEMDAKEEYESQEREYLRTIQRLEEELDGIQNEITFKAMSISRVQHDQISNMVPFEALDRERTDEVERLERELKMLEGEEDEADFVPDLLQTTQSPAKIAQQVMVSQQDMAKLK